MEITKKKLGLTIVAVACAGVLLGAFLTSTLMLQMLRLYGNIGVDIEARSIHCTVTFIKDGKIVFQQHHAGVVTNIGDNQTLYWIFGNDNMKKNGYTSNVTWISIGNQPTLSESSTQLPGEWNRTTVAFEDQTQSALNMTCTFYPDAGPYTADCIGLNWANTGDGNLWGYDTFTEVTGIDSSFTINCEFKVSVSHI